MKYKIIPDDIVKNMIEFLDEIQFEAAASNKREDLHRINFCIKHNITYERWANWGEYKILK